VAPWIAPLVRAHVQPKDAALLHNPADAPLQAIRGVSHEISGFDLLESVHRLPVFVVCVQSTPKINALCSGRLELKTNRTTC
jgi:hypothetical protein